MKVVFDQQVFLLQEYGGISRYICSLAKSLSQLPGMNVKIIAPLHYNYYLSKTAESNLVWGYRVPRINKVHRLVSYVNHISKYVAYIIVKILSPDILHETYFSSASSVFVGTKRVVTVYDMITEKFPESFTSSDFATEQKRKTFQRADHIICISENTRRDLIDIFDIQKDKTSTVYLGYDTLTPKANPENELQLITDAKPYLLFVGRRGGYKNAFRLIEVYGKSTYLREKYALVFFGGGEFTEEERRVISETGLAGNQVIQIEGDDGDLAYMYKMAAAFVYPSLYEGFGIPPLEAMSLGCPVICSNTSSIPEVVGDAAELFPPDDIDSMRIAIEKVVQSSARKKDLVSKGYERVKLFTWERCAKETYRIYRGML